MALVPPNVVRRELTGLGCEVKDEPHHHQHNYGQGQWWVTGSGSEFFVQWATAGGDVDDRVLKRIMMNIIRTRPTLN